MRQFWSFMLTLLLVAICGCTQAQNIYYGRRSFYSSIAPPASRFVHSQHGFVPLSYHGDLHSDESKRHENSKKFVKKSPSSPYRPYASDEEDYSSERYASGEFSSEAQSYHSRENDSREYTIGTQIRVQHPITVSKKSTSPYPKHSKYITTGPFKPSSSSSSFSDFNLSTEDRSPVPSKRPLSQKFSHIYEPDPFHVVSPPKATASSSTNSYSVYEPDHDDFDVLPSGRTKSFDRYKGVASKKQIEAYLEDQKKILDEALKIQLLNDPKIQKYLKSKVNEQRPDLELEDYESYPPSLTPPIHGNEPSSQFKPSSNRLRRRPQTTTDSKRSPKIKHVAKPKRKFRSSAVVISV